MNSTNRFKALAGLPIEVSDGTCLIYPAKLIEIAELGIEEYFKYVNLLTLSASEVKQMLKEDITPFNFLFINSIYKENFGKEFEKALTFFTRESILLLPDLEAISIGNFEDSRMITEENFTEIQNIIKFQNFIFDDIVKFKGENESAKHIKDRLAKAKEKVERAKRVKEESKIEISDLVGSLTSRTSLNILEVWNISYYSFNDQFKRMRLLESYETGLQSLMAGADPKKIKLKDWIQSIQ